VNTAPDHQYWEEDASLQYSQIENSYVLMRFILKSAKSAQIYFGIFKISGTENFANYASFWHLCLRKNKFSLFKKGKISFITFK
jgi:hypothetical protein